MLKTLISSVRSFGANYRPAKSRLVPRLPPALAKADISESELEDYTPISVGSEMLSPYIL